MSEIAEVVVRVNHADSTATVWVVSPSGRVEPSQADGVWAEGSTWDADARALRRMGLTVPEELCARTCGPTGHAVWIECHRGEGRACGP